MHENITEIIVNTYLPKICSTMLQPYVSIWHEVWAPFEPIQIVESLKLMSGNPTVDQSIF